jgi:hypothetical protein
MAIEHKATNVNFGSSCAIRKKMATYKLKQIQQRERHKHSPIIVAEGM